ncbi:hypothetical protein Tco_0483766 [Tanacetum coccineum]
MSFITAQQAKLDLELVPKEKRLEIGKCNGRLNPGKIQREPTFQVVLDALSLTPCYSAFLITIDGQEFDALPTDEEIVSFLRDLGHTREIHSLDDVVVDQMHQPWRTFDALINRSLSGKTSGLDKLRLSRAQILWGIPEMKETKAYKTYFGFAIGATPPKKAQTFKKPAFPKLTTVPISTEEPTGKSKRVMRPAKKSTKASAIGVVIRETPKIPLFKKKEKVDVTRGKGIELLSHVALNEDAQVEEVRRKSMRDFHKTHPSSFGAVNIIPLVTSERTGVKPGVPGVTKIESSESEARSWGNDKDDRNKEQDSSGEDSDQENDSDNDKTQSDNDDELNSQHETDENESGSEFDQEENKEDEYDEEEVKDELVKTPSNDSDDEDETKITDKAEGDEDKEMDYTTSQLYDDVDIRLNEPVDTDKVFVQEEGTDAAMNNTEILVTSFSHSSNLAAKFLNFSDIPHTDAEVVSPMDVHVHHEVPSQQTPKLLTVHVSIIVDSSLVFSTVIPQSFPSFTPPPQQSTSTPPLTTKAINPQSALPNFASVFQFNNRVTALEKEVVELKKDHLHTQVTALVDDHLDARLGATREEFMNFLLASLTARITKQMVKESLEDDVLAKESSQPQFSYEVAATLIEFELKKILINKMDKSESYLVAPEHRECYEGLKKSYDLDKSIFSTYGLKKRKTGKDAVPAIGPKAKESQSGSSKDSDMPEDQDENLGKDDEEPKENVAS